jgi:hypothetical protein
LQSLEQSTATNVLNGGNFRPRERLKQSVSDCCPLPHGSRLLLDCEFPGNLEHLRNYPVLTEEVKEKILYKNAKRLFNL